MVTLAPLDLRAQVALHRGVVPAAERGDGTEEQPRELQPTLLAAAAAAAAAATATALVPGGESGSGASLNLERGAPNQGMQCGGKIRLYLV